jgi:succinate-acetate transporter protein
MQQEHTINWANPSPAGLVALAVACFCFFAILTNAVDETATPLLGLWLLGGFVVQVIVALIDLKSGNTVGGNTFLFFSAFFMLVGGLGNTFKFFMSQEQIVLDTHIDGWAWLVLTIALWLWTPAFLKSPLILCLIVLTLDMALPILTLIDLGVISAKFSYIPGWLLLVVGILGIYLASAIIVNDTFQRKIYPNPGPLLKYPK